MSRIIRSVASYTPLVIEAAASPGISWSPEKYN